MDAEQVHHEVEEQGRRCLLLPGDLKDQAFCREVVEQTVDRLGGLNILVSNAAYLNSKLEVEQLTAEDFDRTCKTNVYAYFHLVMAALPCLEPGDAAIATATEEALKGSTTMIDYAASKAALITLTKSIAPHLAGRGVRANVGTGPDVDAAERGGTSTCLPTARPTSAARHPWAAPPSRRRSRRPTSISPPTPTPATRSVKSSL